MFRLLHLLHLFDLADKLLSEKSPAILRVFAMSKRTAKTAGRSAGRRRKATKSTDLVRQSSQVQILVDGVQIDVPPELEAAVRRARNGQSLPVELTTTQAAEFLDVSRPFVIKLISCGELPCRMVGKHRRISTAAVVEHREKMFQRARMAADKMAQRSQELGLYELEGPARKGR
jgi:excisionase family DNA binding protein